ncbi:structure-specific endonuclease subunit SLX1 [Humulus lupulus]|uniref:structure-specific endonuclease subunit SLX1 n=1 Tax=Humulus lupulus TaxID=3486 RepID=UPI002B417A56|nr:structure-specific endonuclease subunit SLX1 [Humulus lupulus]
MRQRKVRQQVSETLAKESTEDDGEIIKGFFACYLLVSLNPRHKSQTYIGFTVNPRRRIRQHNGEIGCGAWRTKKRRPWEMVFCIYGFPTNVSALQFEWAWQHPTESLAVRKAAASFKSLSGMANKIKLAYTMLTLPSWQSMKITVNFFSTKYTKHSAGCPSLPGHMRVKVCPMDELPCYVEWDGSLNENEDEWDNEELDGGACDASKFSEDTSSDSIQENSEEHDHNGFEKIISELCESISEGEDCTELSSFSELNGRPSSNVCGSSFTREDIAEDTVSSTFIKHNNFELKRSAMEDNDQPPSKRYIVPSEVEVIDVTTPSPVVCRSSLWGNNFCQRARNKEHHTLPSEAEVIDLTSPSPLRRSSLFVG